MTDKRSVPIADTLDNAQSNMDAIWKENDRLAGNAANLIRQLTEALDAWEAWEAEWILNGDWSHGHVLMRDADMEALTPIQEKRTVALQLAYQGSETDDG